MQKPLAVRAGTVIDDVRRVARPHGYTVAVHGSLRADSDIDLIALPWNAGASPRGLVSKTVNEIEYLILERVFRGINRVHYIFKISRPAAGCPGILDLVIWGRHG